MAHKNLLSQKNRILRLSFNGPLLTAHLSDNGFLQAIQRVAVHQVFIEKAPATFVATQKFIIMHN
ncbi:hypothetical protein [Candidatus Methylomicrobium oryzae]|jgi:hypothetical protein|uniref:hypothetical protein n=1 Tax=Candidatus Methylomicrobium oryzae TaxID=2802053 RepID=UPI0019248EA6|nr:hypothetical protein [Methylomicrobium sp. RS1]MBL1265946.1 hypothetical protein [Methylomicrobium sp. RS1]